MAERLGSGDPEEDVAEVTDAFGASTLDAAVADVVAVTAHKELRLEEARRQHGFRGGQHQGKPDRPGGRLGVGEQVGPGRVRVLNLTL